MTTMTVFAVALSRAPRSSSQVISITMPNAGRLIRIGMPSNVRCGRQQAADVRIRAEQRRAITGGQPRRQIDADAPHQ